MVVEDHVEHALSDRNVVVETVPVLQIVRVANAGMMVAVETLVDLVPMAKHAPMVSVLEQEEKLAEHESAVMTELVDPAVLAQQVKDVEEEHVNASMIVMREIVEQQ